MASTPPPRSPPPLKSRRQKPEADAREAAFDPFAQGPDTSGHLELNFSEPSLEDQASTPDDPSLGEWLFKENGVVLGPVSAAVLLQRIDEGNASPDTPIGRSAGNWNALADIPYFYKAQKKVEARRLRIEAQREHEQLVRRRSMSRFGALAALVVLPLLAGSVLGHTVVKSRFWDKSDEWAKAAPQLVELKPKPKPKPKVEAKPVRVAKLDEPAKKTEEAVAEATTDAPAPSAKSTRKTSSKKTRRSASKVKKPAKVVPAKEEVKKKPPVKVASAAKSSASLPTKLSRKQIMTGFSRGGKRIGSCLKKEKKRNPDMPARVRVDFTIKENGKATGIKLLEREVRKGPLATCMKKAVAALTWPKYNGARQNVTIPLTVKKN